MREVPLDILDQLEVDLRDVLLHHGLQQELQLQPLQRQHLVGVLLLQRVLGISILLEAVTLGRIGAFGVADDSQLNIQFALQSQLAV